MIWNCWSRGEKNIDKITKSQPQSSTISTGLLTGAQGADVAPCPQIVHEGHSKPGSFPLPPQEGEGAQIKVIK